jgi:allantoate deiminase
MTPGALERAAVVVDRCRALAGVSDDRGRLVRLFASPAMERANALVASWMQEAGLAVHVDAAGNLVGRAEGLDPRAGTLVLGSHLDTVRDAGAFDGPLGVIAAIAALAARHERGAALPYAVEVIAFSDEEGVRFGTAYLGSRAIAGTFPTDLLELVDEQGVSMREALLAFGGDPSDLESASRFGDDLIGYCELHIEQGPVLEERGLPLGVVSAIAGATRAEVTFTGLAGHAGTVPMMSRRDALAAAAEWTLAVEDVGRSTPGLLATVGRLEGHPGAPNVISGRAVATLDARHADDAVRAEAVAKLEQLAAGIARRRSLELTWSVRLDNPAVAMDPELSALLGDAVEATGQPLVRLPSGAGHDAAALADLVGVAMLFVRCDGGISHHPDESVHDDDVAAALVALDGFLERVAERRR